MAFLRESAQYPEERSSDWQNVAVARRKALRGSGSLAIQRERNASSPLKCALRRATSPHVWRGIYSHLGRASAARTRECGCLTFKDETTTSSPDGAQRNPGFRVSTNRRSPDVSVQLATYPDQLRGSTVINDE